LVCVAIAVCAQVPPRCVCPTEFEGRIFEIDPGRGWALRAKYSYDFANARTCVLEEIFDGASANRDYYQRINLWKAKKSYLINLKDKTCQIEEIKSKFRRMGVPTNATFTASMILGSSASTSAGLPVNMWYDSWPGEGIDWWYGTYSDLDCLPVSESFSMNSTGYIHTTWFDITLGISDPDVFIPPPECTKAVTVPLSMRAARRRHSL